MYLDQLQCYRLTVSKVNSLATHGNELFAAVKDDAEVYVYRYNSNESKRFKRTRHIKYNMTHDALRMQWPTTLCIKRNQLQCVSSSDAGVKIYSGSGELLQEHGGTGSSGSRLKHPRISCDNASTVFICDEGDITLYAISDDGSNMTIVKLKPPVSKPRNAVMFENHLYVTSAETNQIYKYAACSQG